MEEFIKDQVKRLKPIRTIIDYVQRRFGQTFSLRSFKRYMRDRDIQFYVKEDPNLVIQAVQNELNSPRMDAGIRRMQLRLRMHYNLLVTRQEVWDVLTVVDPDRMQRNRRRRLRRRQYISQGSNYTWHVDQHDKLREFGICIHGCVDGFSRKILWLEAYSTTSAFVVAKYFFNQIYNHRVIPARIRSDHGNENAYIARMQMYLRRNHLDQFCFDRSFMYGSSQFNQPIENMWSRFKDQHEIFWINIFKELKDHGLWQYGIAVDKWCLLYVFMPLVKQSLQEYMSFHNSHRIRKQRNAARPNGIPEDMYAFPNQYGAAEMGHVPTDRDLQEVENHFNLDNSLPDYIPDIVRNVLDRWVTTNNIIVNIGNASDIYVRLRNYINANI